MLMLQIQGIMRLSIPLIVVAHVNPSFILSMRGIVLCSLAMGLFITYLNYQVSKNSINGLLFTPSGQYKQAFDQEIIHCGMHPDNVRLRYVYSDDMIAAATFNTIQIDPLMWKDVDLDEQAIKAKEVLTTYVTPSLTPEKKAFHAKINNLLVVPAQRFIFKHELGHLFYNYTVKRLIVLGIIGALATLTGLVVAGLATLYIPGILAIILGMLVGGSMDLVFTYCSNVIFKYREEKNADLFAARYSSADEIEAAALFFEQYQLAAHDYTKNKGLLSLLPQVVRSGHPDGKSRAAYLRTIAFR